ncbi:hypothetical protein CEXT_494191 [Caerostris extrusa]|uniref:Uncharacterized protein n=1 Tax=Caerostris extrusa TaxID=172846 RepID=A0AAV4YCR5_CAEEX|nr:hypothetical protein CEXT_494191 [Caerostris extrusa]
MYSADLEKISETISYNKNSKTQIRLEVLQGITISSVLQSQQLKYNNPILKSNFEEGIKIVLVNQALNNFEIPFRFRYFRKTCRKAVLSVIIWAVMAILDK